MSVTVKFSGVRIEKSEFYQQKHYTVLAAPAPDAFSFPSKYRVTSDKPLGNQGTVLDVECTMRGVVRPKSFVDKQTGQQKSYDECDVYFDVQHSQLHVALTPLAAAK
ncbi:MAG: hypothetical protein EOO52_19990 [Gammaproteobacteria bacterium]|nr:MAG: hypothetical protein EOO52_19990 [Gammaproteobacteria bacterium]